MDTQLSLGYLRKAGGREEDGTEVLESVQKRRGSPPGFGSISQLSTRSSQRQTPPASASVPYMEYRTLDMLSLDK
jgi:hypothetical protein